MPRHTSPLPHVLLSAMELDVADPIRDACRVRVAEMRDRYPTPAAMAAALGCSQRSVQRVLRRYAVRGYTERRSPVVRGTEHPVQPWCSCVACLQGRRVA